jgi:hypothetical protein
MVSRIRSGYSAELANTCYSRRGSASLQAAYIAALYGPRPLANQAVRKKRRKDRKASTKAFGESRKQEQAPVTPDLQQLRS